jgi:hypothetical protein
MLAKQDENALRKRLGVGFQRCHFEQNILLDLEQHSGGLPA